VPLPDHPAGKGASRKPASRRHPRRPELPFASENWRYRK
jgi:hypothetical protein